MDDTLAFIYIPRSWDFVRIAGRKHHEVASHIMIDDKILCGIKGNDFVLDSSRIITPHLTVYNYYGRTIVEHRICRSCWNKALKHIKETNDG